MKKKIFALLMAMVIVLGMSTTALAETDSPVVDNTPEINSPTGDNEPIVVGDMDVIWSETSPWTIVAENVVVGDGPCEYYADIYKEGKYITSDYRWVYKDEKVSFDLSHYIDYYGPGKYTIKTEVYDPQKDYALVFKGTVADRTYVKPEKQLAAPTNFAVDLKTEKVTFNQVEGVKFYDFWFCQADGISEMEYRTIRIEDDNLSDNKVEYTFDGIADAVESWKENYEGRDFKLELGVCAVSDDIDKVAYSDMVRTILFENKLSKEEVKENFDKAFENVKDNPVEALIVLQVVSNETILEMVATDAEFAEKVKTLDEIYIENLDDGYKGATSKTDAVDASKVTVVGAAINGYYADTVELTFTNPEKEVTVPEEYKKGVQLDISLFIDENSMENLSVPVTITMPIPAGVAKENLVLLHYHGVSETPDVIVPTVNADGTMTFSVTGFSTFVVTNEVVEEAPEKPAPEAPKTGDTSGTALVCSLLFLAAGVVLVMKRNSFAK